MFTFFEFLGALYYGYLFALNLLFLAYFFGEKKKIKLFLLGSMTLLVGISFLLIAFLLEYLVVLFFFLFTVFYFVINGNQPKIVLIKASLILINYSVTKTLAMNMGKTILHIWDYPQLIRELYYYSFSLFFVPLIAWVSVKFYQKVIGNFKYQTLSATVLCLLSFYLNIKTYLYLALDNELGFQGYINFLSYLIFLLCFLAVFFFYDAVQKKQQNLEMRKKEYEAMENYTRMVEEQYENMRKFRHDYQNILLTLDSYLKENDHLGLKKYYYQQVLPSGELLSERQEIEDLGRIHTKALKSLLAVKLLTLQSLESVKIDLEVHHTIDWQMDHLIPLVRAVGIILDNAIEELHYLGRGKLQVILLQEENICQIKVSNTCRENLPSVRKLKEQNYSLKKDHQGLGLVNLQELGNKYDFFVETTIENQCFTQTLIFEEYQSDDDLKIG